jgi:hypothetical protein
MVFIAAFLLVVWLFSLVFVTYIPPELLYSVQQAIGNDYVMSYLILFLLTMISAVAARIVVVIIAAAITVVRRKKK